jgi:RIO kinase 1
MTDQLDVLLADGVIDEVLGRLKSGKEANISLVRRGADVIAAKVYKDRATRSFKNNAGYKEGRKVRNSRTERAMQSGGRFGRDAAEQAWKSAEADALYKLVGTGVRVPEPVMFYEGVLLMDLVRDAEGRPAPRLIDVAIEREAAMGVFADLVAQMISMLCCDVIHGDLSPYNILAAAEGPTIIDFPQVVSAVHNLRAEYFFLRDFDNVVRFLAGFDPGLAAHTADGRAIWRAYVSRELTPQFVPPPPPPPRAARGPDRPSRSDERGRARDQRPMSFGGGGPSQTHSDGRSQQSRDHRPQQARSGRAEQPRDGRPQQPRDGRPQQPRDGRPQQPRDGRPQQPRDARPQQPQPPRPPNERRNRSTGLPSQRSGGPSTRGGQPAPHSAASPSRPSPPVPARWSDDRPSNTGPARVGRRRRPKRRW